MASVPYTVFTHHADGGFAMDGIRFGRGPRTLVILPGLSLKPIVPSAAAIAAAYAPLTDTHTVYLLDRRFPVPDGYSIAAMADDTAAVMRELGLGAADILGVSQGGMIALLLAIRHPAQVSRAVLVSSMARLNETARRTMTEWLSLAEAGNAAGLVRSFASLVYTEATRCAMADAFAAMEREGATDTELHRFATLSAACLSFDCLDELSSVRCPVLVIGGEQDRVLSADASREIARAIGCDCFLYPEGGHAVYDEEPDFCGRLCAFFGA